ncbi:Glycosyl hydrolase family 10 [Verrucomicrobiia bacterium DG1235]|nr:Glycosyl hydrolase family 10 [Verrucomicrobiae bacterium DG1235]
MLADDSSSVTPLKDAFDGKFLVGATLNGWMLSDADHPAYELIETHFNSVSPANAMKWGPMNPSLDEYELEPADTFAAYGAAQGLDMIGHTLFWHSQTPDWVFEDEEGNPLTREALLERMRERARMMAARYADRVKTWDVVNESIESDGSWRKSKFQQIIGDDFTEQAFRIAMEELPSDCVFLYNDYSMTDEGRRDAVVAMAKDFQAKGIKIDGIGMQGHWGMDFPDTKDIAASFEAYASTGLKVHITELDIDLLGRDRFFGANVDIRKIEVTEENNPFPDGKLPPEEEERFATRYAEIFDTLLKHSDTIERVTFWGVTDQDSWLNFFPVRGRTNFALLFNRENEPKPAFHRVVETAKKH